MEEGGSIRVIDMKQTRQKLFLRGGKFWGRGGVCGVVFFPYRCYELQRRELQRAQKTGYVRMENKGGGVQVTSQRVSAIKTSRAFQLEI